MKWRNIICRDMDATHNLLIQPISLAIQVEIAHTHTEAYLPYPYMHGNDALSGRLGIIVADLNSEPGLMTAMLLLYNIMQYRGYPCLIQDECSVQSRREPRSTQCYLRVTSPEYCSYEQANVSQARKKKRHPV